MKSLEIQNYQGIEKAKLKLSPGVNILIGESDTGKSSVLRAIRDLAFNATGTDKIRAGQKKAIVELDRVRWEKHQKTSKYDVGGVLFENVGRTSPDEVKAETGIVESEFGDGIVRRIQIAEQIGRHFMIDESPADNAKILGKLTDLNAVFNGLRTAESERKAYERRAKDLEGRLEVIEDTLAEARQAADTATQAHAESKERYTGWMALVERLEALTALNSRLEAATARTDALEAAQERLGPVPDVEALQGVCDRLEGLTAVGKRYSTYFRTAAAAKRDFEALPTKMPRKDLTRLDYLRSRLTDLIRISGPLEARQIAVLELEGQAVAAPDDTDVAALVATLDELRTLEMRIADRERAVKERQASATGAIPIDEITQVTDTMAKLVLVFDKYRQRDSLVVVEMARLDKILEHLAELQPAIDSIESCPTCGQPMKAVV